MSNLTVNVIEACLGKEVIVHGRKIKFGVIFNTGKYNQGSNPAIVLNADKIEELTKTSPGIQTRTAVIVAFCEQIAVEMGSRTDAAGKLFANPVALRQQRIDNGRAVAVPANYSTPRGEAQLYSAQPSATIWLNGLGDSKETWNQLAKILPEQQAKNSDSSNAAAPANPASLNSEGFVLYVLEAVKGWPKDAQTQIENLVELGEAGNLMLKMRNRTAVMETIAKGPDSLSNSGEQAEQAKGQSDEQPEEQETPTPPTNKGRQSGRSAPSESASNEIPF